MGVWMMKKKKTVRIVCLCAAAVLVIGLVTAYFILSTTYDIDDSYIVPHSDYRIEVTLSHRYLTLTKFDADGNASDEPIKVIAFTDTHLDAKKEKGDTTLGYIVRNIVREQPDLVVFVGDNITAGFNRQRAGQFCRTLEELGVYWAAVLGNHEGDNIWSMSRPAMLKKFASYEHCLIDTSQKYTSSNEKVWGNGNFVINLADSEGKIYQSLYFLDSGSDMTEEDIEKYADEVEYYDSEYDYLKDSQITWYKETVRDIEQKNGAPVPSTMFIHIPLNEYKTAYEEITGETEVTPNAPLTYNEPNENGTELLMGQRREGICCPGHNSGMFDAIMEMGSTKLVVAGHDHINDFAVRYRGVILSYNVPGGYSSYNVVSKGLGKKMIKGYSLYTYTSDGKVDIGQFRNADIYPDEQ